MNKKLYIIALLGTIFFTACDPIIEEGSSMDQKSYTADQLDVKATPVKVNGQNSNMVVIENHSELNGQWIANQLIDSPVQSNSAYDTIYVTKTGANTVSFTGMNYSCKVTKDLTVNVDVITFLTDALKTRLCIGKDGAPTTFANTFDSNKVRVVQEKTEDGKLGNRLYVYNSNPVLSKWSFGSNVNDKNVTNVYVTNTGEFPLKLDYQKADGTVGTLDLGTYTVEGFSYSPQFLTDMTGESGTKTWGWDNMSPDGVWGNGGYLTNSQPGWWKVNLSDIDGQAASKGTIAGDGAEATFTLKLSDMSFTKSDGTIGTFSFDMEDIVKDGWNSGSFKIKGANIPMGYLVNNGNAVPSKYYIVKLDSGHFYLCAPEPGAGEGGTAWFWCFKAIEK